jgi:hypothetical protein
MPTRIANPESQLNSFDIVHPLWLGTITAAVMPAPITTQPINRLTRRHRRRRELDDL